MADEKSTVDAVPGDFAIELAEFIKANPNKLDAQWVELLSESRDPSIKLVITAMEAALYVAATDTTIAEHLGRSPALASIAPDTMAW